MNIYDQLERDVAKIAAGALKIKLPAGESGIAIPDNPEHGDAASNIAMIAAKQLKKKPADIAAEIATKVKSLYYVDDVEVAGPGFVNIRVRPEAWTDEIKAVISQGADYGRSNIGNNAKINLEYGSCNPTGPVHVGHCRGIVFGDALASIMDYCGWDVVREYYVNDAGAQIETLVESLKWRAANINNSNNNNNAAEDVPAGLYPGTYLIEPAKNIPEKQSDKETFAVNAMMEIIKADLEALRVTYDVFFSEKTLRDPGNGALTPVEKAVKQVRDNNPDLVYKGTLPPPKSQEDDPNWTAKEQMLFKATDFGDDADRSLRNAAGHWTYFASDLAYVADKAGRGFTEAIYVLGADHSGYEKRLKAISKALGNNTNDDNDDSGMAVTPLFVQLVKLIKNGDPLLMSKRDGTYVTAAELINAIGIDAVRFLMLTRRAGTPLELDFAKAVEQSKDNPVFYVQYAHARCCSARKQAGNSNIANDADADLSLLTAPSETALMRKVAEWPRTAKRAAESRQPQLVASYLGELAETLHVAWHAGNDDSALRFVVEGNGELTAARLVLVDAVRTVLATGLGLLKVTAPEEMR